MYFEVYLDVLFILQLAMNLLLLCLVNGMMKQKVSKRRILGGAFVASVCSLALIMLPFAFLFRISGGMLLSAVIMGVITFRIKSLTVFLQYLKKLSIGTLLLGGMSMIILKMFPKEMKRGGGAAVVLLVGGLSFLFISTFFRKKDSCGCMVTLYGEKEMQINALLDTGNALVEPISGKPVAVLDKAVFDSLFPGTREGFRIIPYRSVGRKYGLLHGYLLNRIKVETEDGSREYHEVYVGLSEEILSNDNSYKMILNPKILEQKG